MHIKQQRDTRWPGLASSRLLKRTRPCRTVSQMQYKKGCHAIEKDPAPFEFRQVLYIFDSGGRGGLQCGTCREKGGKELNTAAHAVLCSELHSKHAVAMLVLVVKCPRQLVAQLVLSGCVGVGITVDSCARGNRGRCNLGGNAVDDGQVLGVIGPRKARLPVSKQRVASKWISRRRHALDHLRRTHALSGWRRKAMAHHRRLVEDRWRESSAGQSAAVTSCAGCSTRQTM
ncbi:hypothetical protein DL89DRAFT_142003 [Linderina pennispora]|uniref:Uncharacterized protein n=1 Tax=Linderina pennispora TaxID=61395 RepID=A0A1Y1WC97_9FUNG|nr:uncharacterized protein DL89DRAFT_142003 [Linderina pennispora]ORX70846.1 hypothetical protein DL89DRAFT_142003 [Linderina pennispora]